MSRRGSRTRAVLFTVAAALCAVGSVAFASRQTGAGMGQPGETRSVVVANADLPGGEVLTARRAARVLEVREIPERYVPRDALSGPGDAIGLAPHGGIPAGSYLLGSQLAREDVRGAPKLPRGLQPIEIAVSGVGALEPIVAGGGSQPLVDVVAADEPGSTVNPRVRVLARMVPLLSLEPAGNRAAAGAARWSATLAVSRAEALRVIEADNYAREVRLLPRGSAR